MRLDVLTRQYSGPQLAAKLREHWPSDFATLYDERSVCAGLEVIRWLVSLLAEAGLPLPPCNPSDVTMRLVLADIPDVKTASDETKLMVSIAIRDSICALGFDEDSSVDLPLIVEGEYMINKLWSMPNNLVHDSMSWGSQRASIFPLHSNISLAAKEGFFNVQAPENLARTVEGYLGAYRETDGTFSYIQTPPTFIRIKWVNNHHSRDLRPGDFSMFSIKVRDAYFEDGRLTHPIVTASYRLVCVAKRWDAGEEPPAAHLYMPGGRNFFPQNDGKLSPFWSCKDSGEYYLVYQKSSESRLGGSSGPITEGQSETPNNGEDSGDQEASVDRVDHWNEPYRYSL